MARPKFPPAKGKGTGGPRKGAGWGGPAKGQGSDAPAAPQVGPGNRLGVGPHDMSRAERAAEHLARIERIAVAMETAEPALSVMASDKAMDRLVGKAVQTNLNVEPDDIAGLSDADLRAELARLSAAAGEIAAGTAPATVPKRPKNVVH